MNPQRRRNRQGCSMSENVEASITFHQVEAGLRFDEGRQKGYPPNTGEPSVRIHTTVTIGANLFMLVPASAQTSQKAPPDKAATSKPATKTKKPVKVDSDGLTPQQRKDIDADMLRIDEASAHDKYQALLDAEPTERKEHDKLINWAEQVLSSGGSDEDNEARSRSLIAQARERWNEYQAKIPEAKAEWLKALARLKVEDCRKVYQRTIDKKTYDLTVRETELVAGCRSLDLYPPATR